MAEDKARDSQGSQKVQPVRPVDADPPGEIESSLGACPDEARARAEVLGADPDYFARIWACVEHHLDACPTCSARADRWLSALRHLLEGALGKEPSACPSADELSATKLADGVLDHVASCEPCARIRARHRWPALARRLGLRNAPGDETGNKTEAAEQ